MRKQHLSMFVSLLLVAGASAQTPSQLDRVNVVQDADNIRVEMSSKGATGSEAQHAELARPRGGGSAGNRYGHRTEKHRRRRGRSQRCAHRRAGTQATRIVVDLDKACAYDLTPGPAGKLVLTLHAKSVAA